MKKYVIVLNIFIILLTPFLIMSNTSESLYVSSEVPPSNSRDISSLSLDEGADLLTINYMDNRSYTLHLNPNSLETEVFKTTQNEQETYFRFYSPSLYESLGQPSQGIIILTQVDPSRLTSDPNNAIASEFPLAENLTTADLGFAAIYSYIQEHNKDEEGGIPLCIPSTGDDILSKVITSLCYINCNGKSEVMAHFLPAATQVIIMGSRSEHLGNGYIFLWSELHATTEVFSNNGWYVADPTFGFAYVKDSTERRLNAQELIEVLEMQKIDDLTFGLVHNGVIHDVPGTVFIQANSTLPGTYYTPDKSLSYRMVKSNSLMVPFQIWFR